MRQFKNNTPTSSSLTENKGDLAQTTKLEIASGLDYPTMWKRAFAIGQNVRFTRTPEVELLRRRIENDPNFAEKLKQTETETQQIAQNLPQVSNELAQKDAEYANMQAAYISDFAFFEFADLAVTNFDEKAPVAVSHNNSHAMNDTIIHEVIDNQDAKKAGIEATDQIVSTKNHMPDAQMLKQLYREIDCRQIRIAEKNQEELSIAIPAVGDTAVKDKNTENGENKTQVKVGIKDQKEEKQPQENSGDNYNDEKNTIVIDSPEQPAMVAPIMEARVTETVAETEPSSVSAAIAKLLVDEPEIFKEGNEKQAQEIAKTLTPKIEPIAINENNENEPVIEVAKIEVAKKEKTIAHISEKAVVETNATIIEAKKTQAKTETKIVASLPKHNPAFIPNLAQKDYADYQFPTIDYLQQPVYQDGATVSQDTLERSAGLLESVLEDFGIKGEIIHVRTGPVVTLYEFEPAAGVKSSRVIGLSDDIARSMSAISARVAVIPGRNVIGIELPNSFRETVYLREIIAAKAFQESPYKLPLALGKSIGGEPIIAELAKMPHLLVAGTTGSGKSVAINTMILSLLYRLTPDECRLIMVDPKMLELSIYDGIPHLLTPVVTDPKKAVTALKWAVREMEDRYRKMAKLGVRNIDGFNARVAQAVEKGETIMCTVQSGFDKETGEMLYHEEAMDLTKLPFIVVIVDEMADLMMVAGKEIEGAIQRLAQMARAAGIHLIMATQRPSVDVITGTIKANFPTRISFQVTSKIDSRTILGEQGAETLLGQGDMLHMVGGGRIVRVHGPFVSDAEVEQVVAHLKTQGTPDYLATVTDGEEEEDSIDEAGSVADIVAAGNVGEDGEELYLQAVKVVMRDKKCSTSYIQRRLSIGYNKAASLVERMEKEGIVGAANHVGKREILLNHAPKHS